MMLRSSLGVHHQPLNTSSIQVSKRVTLFLDYVYGMHAVPIYDAQEPWVGSQWYGSSNISNVVYVSGHICLNTRRPIRHCTCEIYTGFEKNWGKRAINRHDSTL